MMKHISKLTGQIALRVALSSDSALEREKRLLALVHAGVIPLDEPVTKRILEGNLKDDRLV